MPKALPRNLPPSSSNTFVSDVTFWQWLFIAVRKVSIVAPPANTKEPPCRLPPSQSSANKTSNDINNAVNFNAGFYSQHLPNHPLHPLSFECRNRPPKILWAASPYDRLIALSVVVATHFYCGFELLLISDVRCQIGKKEKLWEYCRSTWTPKILQLLPFSKVSKR